MKKILKKICPPIVYDLARSLKYTSISPHSKKVLHHSPEKQALDIYWDNDMANLLETWGEGTVWNEIQFLLSGCHGKVLDIACGTGKTMQILADSTHIDLYGCDISDLLLDKALRRGISQEKLKQMDATHMSYDDNEFTFAYSIGSLEHFTEEGISQFIYESRRVTSHSSFHMIPTSRSKENEGWMTTQQSFFNNSVEWWLGKYQTAYTKVHVVDSAWHDDISVGKWFICKE